MRSESHLQQPAIVLEFDVFKLSNSGSPVVNFEINGKSVEVDVPEDTPLLWVVREELGLKGTKFGCGRALCGACTMHLNGNAIRSCMIPVAAAANQKLTTIEGIQADKHHPVQKAWIKHNVPQCGYCQSGQIMQAISTIQNQSQVTEAQLNQAMDGNICRCGTYTRIKEALKTAAKEMGKM